MRTELVAHLHCPSSSLVLRSRVTALYPNTHAVPPPPKQSDPLSQPLPPLYIAWLPRGAPHPHAQHVTAPLYATGERAAAIAEVQLPVEGPGEGGGWALAGVALVLQEV